MAAGNRRQCVRKAYKLVTVTQGAAWSNPTPSLNPYDLLIGIICGVALNLSNIVLLPYWQENMVLLFLLPYSTSMKEAPGYTQ